MNLPNYILGIMIFFSGRSNSSNRDRLKTTYSALLFTLILTVTDLIFRWPVVSLNLGGYLLSIPALCFLILFVRQLIKDLQTQVLKVIVILLASIVMGTTYGIQYTFYGIYLSLFSALDISIFLKNFGYWSEHSSTIFGWRDLRYALLFISAFVVYFSGLLDRLIEHVKTLPTYFTESNDSKSPPLKHRLKPIAFLLAGFICLAIAKESGAREHYTPLLYSLDQVITYVKRSERFITKENPTARRQQDIIHARKPRGKFNILFILNESLRTDHTSLFGYSRETTPFLNQYFSESYLYPYAYSNTGLTQSSCQSIFTGVIPVEEIRELTTNSSSTIWQYAKAANMQTFYVSSHWLEWGNMRGLMLEPEHVDIVHSPVWASANLGQDDMETVSQFDRTLNYLSPEDPFFGVIHLSSNHYPYPAGSKTERWSPAEASYDASQLDKTINQYDNSILYLDQAIERIVRGLERSGEIDNTIIVSTADHAEAFYEHGEFFHGKTFWQEGINVPFFIHIPKPLKQYFSLQELQNLEDNRKKFVSNVDVFATLIDVMGLQSTKQVDGESLLQNYQNRYGLSVVTGQGYIVINSDTGEKISINLVNKRETHTNLMIDPKEQNPEIRALREFSSPVELIKYIRK